eukprot:2632286-Heterocapsa_arctica.AAC.1
MRSGIPRCAHNRRSSPVVLPPSRLAFLTGFPPDEPRRGFSPVFDLAVCAPGPDHSCRSALHASSMTDFLQLTSVISDEP